MDAPPPVEERERARERVSARQGILDFGYIRADVRRIIILATAVIVAIIVLSFFLP